MGKFRLNLHSIDETSGAFKMVMIMSDFKALKADLKIINNDQT